MSDVERYKRQQLKCAVLDQPWDTSLAWSDAYEDLPGLTSSEIDRAVIGVMTELLDDGLVYFYEAEDFGESFLREVAESEGLSREEVIAALSEGSERTTEGTIRTPWLPFRATEKGREYYFELAPEDRPEGTRRE